MAINEPAIKLYCQDCLFFVAAEPSPPVYDFGPPEYQLEKCLAPENFKDTYAHPQSLPISQPRIINQYNDCAWFVLNPNANPSSSSSELTLYWTTEIISGNTTGSDTDYVLTYTPADVLLIYINGLLQRDTVDYSLVNNIVIFSEPVTQGSNIQAYYSYLA